LDLIGSTFKKKSDRAFAPNSIEYAVNTFALDLIDFDSQKASALYALRCAFAHDFNLLNVNEKKLHLQHKFNVYAEPTQNIVTMPKEPWDGKIASKSFKDLSNVTFVNLWAFGDMVEEIFVRVIDGISDGTLEIQMDTPTLINKYTFMMFQSQALFDVN